MQINKGAIINNQGLKVLADAFLEKLLTGDGTLNIDKRSPVPRVSIRIKDQSLDYLEDYKEIFKVLGFKGVRIFYRHITVRVNCSFRNLLYLYSINAFKNTSNWNKLLVSIGLCLRGRRLKTKLRFLDLEDLQHFTVKGIARRYNLHPNDRKWLMNSIKDGYIKCVSRKPPYKYQLTEKAKGLITVLKNWKNDLDTLIKLRKITDLRQLLESLKTKGKSTK